ncbi:tetratricopeptide repeat protein [Thermaurantiacus sp.]
MHKSRVAVAVLGALLVAGTAKAAMTIVGGGLGRECYLAAEFKRETSMSLDVCTRALQQETLSRRDRAATLVNRGIIHMQAKDFDRALADYDAALRIDPRLAEAHVNRGIALLYRGGADREALDALSTGLALRPSRPEVAYYSRAVANEMLGNVRAAYEDYQAAAAAKPGWEEPVEQLKRFSVERRPVSRG